MAAAIALPECSICDDELNSPTTALCGHSFCVPCLRAWVATRRARGEVATCPICRGELEQDPARLQVTRVLDELLTASRAAAAAAPRQGSGISPDELALSERIGAGAYGEVWRGELNGALVAVKTCAVAAADAAPAVALAFEREAHALRALRHPSILPF